MIQTAEVAPPQRVIKEVPLVCGHVMHLEKSVPAPASGELGYCRRCQLFEYAYDFPSDQQDTDYPTMKGPHVAECTDCGRTYKLMKKGTIPSHNLSNGKGGHKRCPGSCLSGMDPRPFGTGQFVPADTGPASVAKFVYRFRCLQHMDWFDHREVPGEKAMKEISSHFDSYRQECCIEYSTGHRWAVYGRNNEERKTMRAMRKAFLKVQKEMKKNV